MLHDKSRFPIDHASQLLTVFPQHVLTISSKAHALVKWSREDNACTLPTAELLIRYEPDKSQIFVDNALFKKYGIADISEKLRRNTQYVGARMKRMVTGLSRDVLTEHGLSETPRNALVFDLKKIDAVRAETRRARRRPEDHKDKALDVIRHAETTLGKAHAAYARTEKRLTQISRDLNSPGNAHLPAYWFEAQKEIRSALEECLFMLDIGKNLYAEISDLSYKYNTPLRFKTKRIRRPQKYSQGERVRIEAFDKMIGIEAVYIYRERFYWSDKTGSLMEHKKEFVPDTDATLWSGYYKEWSFSDGTGVQKWLWIPVALLNTYTHKDSTILSPEEKEQLKFYRTDIRYVSTEVKRIGGKAHRCAKFDMRRSVNPAKEEPPRTPEKNKHKSA